MREREGLHDWLFYRGRENYDGNEESLCCLSVSSRKASLSSYRAAASTSGCDYKLENYFAFLNKGWIVHFL